MIFHQMIHYIDRLFSQKIQNRGFEMNQTEIQRPCFGSFVLVLPLRRGPWASQYLCAEALELCSTLTSMPRSQGIHALYSVVLLNHFSNFLWPATLPNLCAETLELHRPRPFLIFFSRLGHLKKWGAIAVYYSVKYRQGTSLLEFSM